MLVAVKRRDVGRRPRLLVAELVAREEEHREPRIWRDRGEGGQPVNSSRPQRREVWRPRAPAYLLERATRPGTCEVSQSRATFTASTTLPASASNETSSPALFRVRSSKNDMTC